MGELETLDLLEQNLFDAWHGENTTTADEKKKYFRLYKVVDNAQQNGISIEDADELKKIIKKCKDYSIIRITAKSKKLKKESDALKTYVKLRELAIDEKTKMLCLSSSYYLNSEEEKKQQIKEQFKEIVKHEISKN